VKRLITILNKEIVNGAKLIVPKVIIFVKDRIVAQYLKNILQKQTEIRGTSEPNNNKLLSHHYKVDMAMGPRGKNLLNKAYKSTKTSLNSTAADSSFDDGDSNNSGFTVVTTG
jgi:hypothetical protein